MKTNHQPVIHTRSSNLFAYYFFFILFGRKTWFQIISMLSAMKPFGGIKAKNQCTHSTVFFSSYTMFPNLTCDHFKTIVWSNKFCFVKFQVFSSFSFLGFLPRRCFIRVFLLFLHHFKRTDATESGEAFGYWVAARKYVRVDT